MSYFTIVDVRAALPPGVKIDDVEASALNAQITRVQNRVNVALAAGNVAMPVTDTELLGDIADFGIREVLYRVLSGRSLIEEQDKKPEYRVWHDEFKEFLASVRGGDYTASVADAAAPESYTMNAEEDTTDPGLQPQITRNRKF